MEFIVGILITAISQLLLLVWVASKFHAGVTALEKTVEKLGATLDNISDKVHEHSTEIAILKERSKDA